MKKIENVLDFIMQNVWDYLPKLIVALIILFIGLKLIQLVKKLIKRMGVSGRMDPTVASFTSNIVEWLLKIMLFISVAGMLGIDTTSFLAMIGAAGLAIGLALQGSLANFAGGVQLLVFKPFKVGDTIEIRSMVGIVKAIHLMQTCLLTPDNKTIYIPNASIVGGDIVNYTNQDKRRVEINVGIGYRSDLKLAKELIEALFKEDKRIIKDPAPFVGVKQLGESSVDLVVRVWAKTDAYWDVYFSLIEKIKYCFDENGIEIPYPQRDIRIRSDQA